MSVVVALERDPHAAVLALLPWFARGQLDDDEMSEVQAHLLGCPACRAEFEAEQSMQALHRLPLPAAALGAAGGVEAGRARMRARIGERKAAAPRPTLSAGTPRWLGWVLGLQGGAIAVMLLLLIAPRPDGPAYRGLAAPAPATAQALIMFRPEASERQIRETLLASGASLSGGPTESRAYVLQLPREGRQEALQRLRRQPIVTLVESLEARAWP